MEVPRDGNSGFEPIIVPKNKRNISGIKDKVVSLYASDVSTRDIYGIELFADMVSKIIDRIIPENKRMHNTSIKKLFQIC